MPLIQVPRDFHTKMIRIFTVENSTVTTQPGEAQDMVLCEKSGSPLLEKQITCQLIPSDFSISAEHSRMIMNCLGYPKFNLLLNCELHLH